MYYIRGYPFIIPLIDVKNPINRVEKITDFENPT